HVAREKVLASGTAPRVTFHCLPMEQLSTLMDGPAFDGVFSNFGAVNCVEDLPKLIAEVAARLTRAAPLVWVVMGRHVPWEWMWYLARGQPGKAMRRYKRAGAN